MIATIAVFGHYLHAAVVAALPIAAIKHSNYILNHSLFLQNIFLLIYIFFATGWKSLQLCFFEIKSLKTWKFVFRQINSFHLITTCIILQMKHEQKQLQLVTTRVNLPTRPKEKSGFGKKVGMKNPSGR